jgi:hypothetical protein
MGSFGIYYVVEMKIFFNMMCVVALFTNFLSIFLLYHYVDFLPLTYFVTLFNLHKLLFHPFTL